MEGAEENEKNMNAENLPEGEDVDGKKEGKPEEAEEKEPEEKVNAFLTVSYSWNVLLNILERNQFSAIHSLNVSLHISQDFIFSFPSLRSRLICNSSNL